MPSVRKRGAGVAYSRRAFFRSIRGNRTRRSVSKMRTLRRRTRKNRKSRRRSYSGGGMYPNDDNTVIVDREDDSPDSVMRARSYDREMDNPIASQNSSV